MRTVQEQIKNLALQHVETQRKAINGFILSNSII